MSDINMTEPEFIPFTIDEDDWLPQKRRRQTKDQALYGVFNREESDEETYDKPVQFTSAHRPDKAPRDHHSAHSQPTKPADLEKMYGVGLKLMQMKGFQVGKGIGKHGQGRVDPVEVARRGRKEGLSFAKPESAAAVKPQVLKTPSWAQPKSELIRPGRSIQEVREDLQEMLVSQPGVLTSITDMRSGAPVKIVDFSQLSAPQYKTQLRAAESQELLQLERRVQTDKDTLLALEYEEKQLQLTIDKTQQLLVSQASALDYLDSFLEADLDALALVQTLRTFEHNWLSLAETFGLREKYALSLGTAAFKRLWRGWRFEEEPLRGLKAAKEWTNWLTATSAWLFEPWQVQAMLFISTRWSPRQERGELIDNLALWKGLLPKDVWDAVSTEVKGKLQRELESWEPRTARVPLHTWVHPWLSLLDLSDLWGLLVPKLAKVLANWHPADPSAKAFLSPWKDVLGSYWVSLLKRHILPKLVQVLHELPLDSAECEMVDWVLAWLDMFPVDELTSVLLSEFYPRWRRHLKALMSQPSFDLDAMESWYSEWQRRIPVVDLSKVFSELGL
jgi:tuftelin-interacting protein 11